MWALCETSKAVGSSGVPEVEMTMACLSEENRMTLETNEMSNVRFTVIICSITQMQNKYFDLSSTSAEPPIIHFTGLFEKLSEDDLSHPRTAPAAIYLCQCIVKV